MYTQSIKQTLKELVLAFGVVLLLIQFMGCIGATQDRQAAYASIRSNTPVSMAVYRE